MPNAQSEKVVKIPLGEYSTQTVELIGIEGQSVSANPPPARKLIILIPGAIRSGQWATEWHDYARKKETDFITLPLKHGILGALRVITSVRIMDLIKDKRKEIQLIIDDNFDKDISIVCHSYGCYMLKWVLEFGLSKKFDTVCIIGSILKPKDIGVFSKNSKMVFCHSGTYDLTSSILQLIKPWRFYTSSVFQFNSPYSNVLEGSYPGGHSMGTKLDHFKIYVIPAVLNHIHWIPKDSPKIIQPDWSVNIFRILFIIIFVIFVYCYLY